MSRTLSQSLISSSASAAASTSRAAVRPRVFVRTAATGNPHLQSPSDARLDLLRRSLYPADAHSPSSASPTGAYAPNHVEKLKTVLPSAEAHETIERAWQLYQRDRRQQRTRALEAKFESMKAACDELERITSVPAPSPTDASAASEAEAESSGSSKRAAQPQYPRYLYDRAMSRLPLFPVETPKVRGSKAGPESRWQEARIEGLVPREAWVPTDTRGKGWNYRWRRPGSEKE